jgi:dTDP-4-amino-4,6-dideoxygalactose transaminase
MLTVVRHGDARSRRLQAIEDNAEPPGAEYQGEKVGPLRDAGRLSSSPRKILGAYGDVGIVITNGAEVAEKAGRLHNLGTEPINHKAIPGFNRRPGSLQAALPRVKPGRIGRWNYALEDYRRSGYEEGDFPDMKCPEEAFFCQIILKSVRDS